MRSSTRRLVFELTPVRSADTLSLSERLVVGIARFANGGVSVGSALTRFVALHHNIVMKNSHAYRKS